MLLFCIRKGAFLHVHMLPRKPERCKTGAAWFRKLGRCCTKDLFVSGPGRTACPGGHAWGGTATAVFRRLCRRNVRPPFRCTQAPCRRGPGPILFFRGWERPSPQRQTDLSCPSCWESSTLPSSQRPRKRPLRSLLRGNPTRNTAHIRLFQHRSMQRTSVKRKSIHILPKHKTDAFRNMQKASAVKNYFSLRQN